jgi:hypothetical protein
MLLRVKKATWLKKKEDIEFKIYVEKEAIKDLSTCSVNIFSEHNVSFFFMNENPYIPEKNFSLIKPHFEKLDY